MNEKVEILYRNISRYDFYISSTNAKCSIVLAYNSLIIGTLLFKFDDIIKLYSKGVWAQNVSFCLLLLIGILSPISIIFAFRVINPFLASGEELAQHKSVVFFGSVAETPFKDYLEKIKSMTDVDIIEDLTSQAKVIADGLLQKMNDMKKAIKLIYGMLVLVLVLFVLKGVLIYV